MNVRVVSIFQSYSGYPELKAPRDKPKQPLLSVVGNTIFSTYAGLPTSPLVSPEFVTVVFSDVHRAPMFDLHIDRHHASKYVRTRTL